MSELRVLHRDQDGRFAALAANNPVWFSDGTQVPTEEQHPGAIGIFPIGLLDGVIGAALVPDELDTHAALNGIPRRAGLHLLRHTDRLDLGEHSVWVAASSVVEVTNYVPAIHGEKAYCYLTKASLKPGQEIVACPAAPGKKCDAIYTQKAWDLAMSSETMRKCANCGFSPHDSAWTPSTPKTKKPLRELLQSLTDSHV